MGRAEGGLRASPGPPEPRKVYHHPPSSSPPGVTHLTCRSGTWFGIPRGLGRPGTRGARVGRGRGAPANLGARTAPGAPRNFHPDSLGAAPRPLRETRRERVEHKKVKPRRPPIPLSSMNDGPPSDRRPRALGGAQALPAVPLRSRRGGGAGSGGRPKDRKQKGASVSSRAGREARREEKRGGVPLERALHYPRRRRPSGGTGRLLPPATPAASSRGR